jgi:prevent-host-death family protein
MLTLQDAKNRFSAVVDAALSGHPQEVSRRGKPVVVVLSVAEYRRLLGQARAGRESFAAHLMNFPGTGAPDADDIPRAQVMPRDTAL